VIILDSREPDELITPFLEAASKAGIDVVTKQLPHGDFLLSPYSRPQTVGIERKRVPDLIHSIQDGRLKKQIAGLKDDTDAAYLMVEGEFTWVKDNNVLLLSLPGKGLTQWRFTSVMNTVAAVQLPDAQNRRVGYQHTANIKESIIWILAFYKMLSKPVDEEARPVDTKILPFKKSDGLTTPPGLAALVQVEGMGPKTARALLQRFKSIAAILQAPDSEVSEVRGVGPALVRAIRREFGERAA
jgi:ERCC4-type nuclease